MINNFVYTNLEEINKHYYSLSIKPYWSEESLGFEIVNQITTMFNTLHILYPNIQIKEIGDVYSYDKEKREDSINYIKQNMNNEAFYNQYETEDIKKKV